MVLASALRGAHVALAWVVVLGNAGVGLWALAAHWRPALRVRALWWATVVAEVALVAEVVLGVVHQNVDEVEPTDFHTLYGFAALAAVGIIYSYRNQMKDRQYLLYGLGGLFLMGMGIRAMVLHR